MIACEKAYAKINLYLDVTAKRADGFHEVVTLMHAVDLYDSLTLCVKPGDGAVFLQMTGEKTDLPTDERNLAVRAARAFLVRTGQALQVDIRLEKRIPIAGGLAGGSSDAAAVLRALNRVCQAPLGNAALLALAATLGSDVPYCLRGGTALCTGRGEAVRAMAHPSYPILLVTASESVSTPAAYRALDALYDDFVPSGTHAPADGAGQYPFFNIFESVVLPMCPGAARGKARLSALGARVALMSGSGPTVFGIFENEQKALSARQILQQEGYGVFYAPSAPSL